MQCNIRQYDTRIVRRSREQFATTFASDEHVTQQVLDANSATVGCYEIVIARDVHRLTVDKLLLSGVFFDVKYRSTSPCLNPDRVNDVDCLFFKKKIVDCCSCLLRSFALSYRSFIGTN